MLSINLEISDVERTGSVGNAIEEWARENDYSCAGVVGQSFSSDNYTACNFNAIDYAKRAIQDEGMLYYVDATDGRVASAGDDGVVWTEDSEVCLRCPPTECVLEYDIKCLAEMAREALTTHKVRSDVRAWKRLIRRIREVATAFEDVEID